MNKLIKFAEMHGNEYVISPANQFFVVILYGTQAGYARQLYKCDDFEHLCALLGY